MRMEPTPAPMMWGRGHRAANRPYGRQRPRQHLARSRRAASRVTEASIQFPVRGSMSVLQHKGAS